MNESENGSLIGSEYLRHLAMCPLDSAALARLASTSRIAEVSSQVPDDVRKRINQMVHDPSDRVFVKVANNSSSGLLCSHDFRHFPVAMRKAGKSMRISVLTAVEASELMS